MLMKTHYPKFFVIKANKIEEMLSRNVMQFKIKIIKVYGNQLTLTQ